MILLLQWIAGVPSLGGPSFVNFETPHVHPIDITPDGSTLLVVNTPDNRLEVFAVTGGLPAAVGAIPVGLDPVSVRARTDDEVWVVNHLSDTVSVVRLSTANVVRTLKTADEPCDVVFAGEPPRAFVSCSQANEILVFDPTDLSAPPIVVPIDAEDPRALAVSRDGSKVYAAIFESGNGSTILVGEGPVNPVAYPGGPHGGVNPPPNDGVKFRPPQNPDNPQPPPRVSLIVRKDADGRWMDDNAGDWSEIVSGSLSPVSFRVNGWDLPDRDLAIVDAATLEVRYAARLMNLCMGLAVSPTTGRVFVVGTDATNQVRYEPVLRGRFLRVLLAGVEPDQPELRQVVDLNPHLRYTGEIPFQPIPQSERNQSIGDPRAMAWNPSGTRGYIAGMGSNNVVVVDEQGARLRPAGQPTAAAIDVGEGPTGLVLGNAGSRLYVLNKFESSVSVIDLATEQVMGAVPFYDPSPLAIKRGRRHLYDTHRTSGLGHVACASCHVDARMDRLAWDLGNPAGVMKVFNQNCFMGASEECRDWHPMKGPMLTQTLQDIIGKEPHHWRGDKDGLEEFDTTFVFLQGDDAFPAAEELQELEDFLATLYFPPNPFRNFDNSLPTNLPLPGHYSTGRFTPAGQPLPNGNAAAALHHYRTGLLDSGIFQCVTCHTLPTGIGTNQTLAESQFVPFPIGPQGEFHHTVTIDAVLGTPDRQFKPPQLRNLYDRVGFDTTQVQNRAGFGFEHAGGADSIARAISFDNFEFQKVQEVANMVAFLLAFSGSDLPTGSASGVLELQGPSGNDTHAAVGAQMTLRHHGPTGPELVRVLEMASLAEQGVVGLVVRGRQAALPRGYVYLGDELLQSDRAAEIVPLLELLELAGPDAELTFMVVPKGSERRIGIDRDEDGHFDRDELDRCSDPADPDHAPFDVLATGDADQDQDVDLADFAGFQDCRAAPNVTATDRPCGCFFDFDRDGEVDLSDFGAFQVVFAAADE